MNDGSTVYDESNYFDYHVQVHFQLVRNYFVKEGSSTPPNVLVNNFDIRSSEVVFDYVIHQLTLSDQFISFLSIIFYFVENLLGIERG